MSESQIEWTDATWNPVVGCTIASTGCRNCYAMEMTRRLECMGMKKYSGLTRRSGKRTVWTGTVRVDKTSLELPLSWRKPKRIFVNSMSDLFHEKVDEKFIGLVWEVMARTPRHHYQILTKRPERMVEILKGDQFPILPNVWLGTSVENEHAVERIETLREVPANIRFISFEPLIGSIGKVSLSKIDWVIVGGESGHQARQIDEEWIDEIYVQCKKQKVHFFFKQWGTWGKDRIRRSKRTNGRIYRNREWNEMPQFSTVGSV